MSEINVEVLAEEEGTGVEAFVDVLKGDKGDKGDQGIQGVPGYTPQKGTDYFTNAEIEEIKSAVKDDVVEEITPTLNSKANANDVYTRTQTDTLLEEKQNNITSFNKLLSDLVDDTNQTNKFVTSTEKTNWNAKYDKPSGGIPKTDLASDVQTSLGKADTAIQEHQDISGKVDKVVGKGLSTEDYTTEEKEKLAELENYDDSELIEQIEALETELEETQTKLDRTRAGLPTTSGEGEYVTLDGTNEDEFIEPPLPIGVTKQDSYTGKNKFNKSSIPYLRTSSNVEELETGVRVITTTTYGGIGAFYKIGDVDDLIGKVIKIHCKATSSGRNNSLFRLGYTNGTSETSNRITISDALGNGDKEISMTVDSSYNGQFVFMYLASRAPSGSSDPSIGQYVDYENLILTIDNADTTYEPYVGGTASPNPDYPQEINNVGNNVNLFDKDNFIYESGFYNDNGVFNASNSTGHTTMNILVEGSKDYTISGFSIMTYQRQGTISRIYFYDINKSWISRSELISNTNKYTFKTPLNCKYIEFQLTFDGDGGNVDKIFQDDVDTFKLEKGTEATPYSPYNCGDVNVTVGNKNLAWNGWAEDFVNRIDNSNQASIVTYSNRNCLKYVSYAGHNQGDTKYLFKTKWKENTRYTIIYEGYTTEGYLNLAIEYTDGTITSIDGTPLSNWSKVFISSLAGKTIKYIRTRYTGGTTYINLNTFMVLEGVYTSSNMQNYIEPQTQTFTFPLSTGQKLMEGDYLADDGVHHVRTQVVLDGTESWVKSGTQTYYNNNAIFNNFKKYNDSRINGTCNKASKNNSGFLDYNYIGHVNVDRGIEVHKANDLWGFEGSEISEFRTWLSENPIELEYELAEEVIDPYTEAQQIVYNQIKKAISYKDQTNIYSTNEVSPTFKVKAYADVSSEIDNLKTAIVALGGVV